MANKYLIHGAAYCGDGTTSAEAPSNGAAGAWNNINVLEGSAPAYGTLVNGDVVNIRSKTSAGADIMRTLAASVTLGSSFNPTTSVTWVLDDGSIWPGVSGVLTYNCPSNYICAAKVLNRYISKAQDAWRIVEANSSASYKNYMGAISVYIHGLLFDFSLLSSSNGTQLGDYSGFSVLSNIHIKSNRRPERLILVVGYANLRVLNPNIELLNPAATEPVFVAGNSGASLSIYGGAITGAGATTGVRVFGDSAQGAVLRSFGLRFPQTMSLANYPGHEETLFSATGSDGLVGSRVVMKWGEINSRTDAYYPTLTAELPNTDGTLWSWWVYPKNANEFGHPIIPIAKVYSEAAAAKEITVEALVATTFSAATKATLWTTVDYTDDATGLPVSVSTQDPSGTALDASTAAWSSTTYGATAYNKRKMTVTTPTAIKPNTLVTVTICCTARAASASDTLIICPDFLVLTP